jgi:hypothetical protein
MRLCSALLVSNLSQPVCQILPPLAFLGGGKMTLTTFLQPAAANVHSAAGKNAWDSAFRQDAKRQPIRF